MPGVVEDDDPRPIAAQIPRRADHGLRETPPHVGARGREHGEIRGRCGRRSRFGSCGAWIHASCLYADETKLFDRLRAAIDGTQLMDVDRLRKLQSALLLQFGAQTSVSRLDDALDRLVAANSSHSG